MEEQNTGTTVSAFTLLQQLANFSYDAVRRTEQVCDLPPVGRKALSSIKLSSMYMNRVCNILNYLSDKSTAIKPDKLESFEIKSLMEEIIFRFENIVSTFNNVSIVFKSKLHEDSLMTVDKTHFEFVILNLLYCAVRTSPDASPQNIKITISIAENKYHLVFRIHDNNRYPSQSDIQEALSIPAGQYKEIDINAGINMTTLSVQVAQKSAEDMNGKLVYTPLKSGNRYDIYLPKAVELPAYMMCSPVRYIPTLDYFNEIFASLALDHILFGTGEVSDEEFEGVIRL